MTTGLLVLLTLVLLVGFGLWWVYRQPVATPASPSDVPVTAPALPHHVTCILMGADGLHSTTHRAGKTHPPILTRPHGTNPATTYTLAEVNGQVGVYQETV